MQSLKCSLCFCGWLQAEAVLKICGFGWSNYWAGGWHKFDFVLVIISLIDIASSFSNSPFGKVLDAFKAQKLLRLSRLTRVLKMLKSMRSTMKLITTVFRSVASLVQVSSLLFLCFFMFAYTGVQLFGQVKKGCGVAANDFVSAGISAWSPVLLFSKLK